MHIRVLIIGVVGVAALAPAHAARPTKADEIVFVADRVSAKGERTSVLYVASADGSTRRRVSAEALASDSPVAWSPAGQHIAFVGSKGALSVVDPDTMGRRRLLAGDNTTEITEQPWVTSNRLAYSHRGDVWTVDTHTGARRRVTRGAQTDKRAVVSPNGRRIAFERNARDRGDGYYGELWIVTIGGRAAKVAVDRSWGWTWSPNSRRLAVATYTGLYVVDGRNGAVREVANDDPHDLPSWSPGGRQIVVSIDLEIYVFDVVNNHVRQLTRSRDEQDFGPSWSPNGAQLAWSKDYKLTVMTPDGRIVRRLGRRTGCDYYSAWSPSGRRIGYSRDVSPCEGPSQLWTVGANGERAVNLGPVSAWQWRPLRR